MKLVIPAYLWDEVMLRFRLTRVFTDINILKTFVLHKVSLAKLNCLENNALQQRKT